MANSHIPDKSLPYWERLRPLGDLRCRVLACLFADNPKLPAYFNPGLTENPKDALRNHFEKLFSQFASDEGSRLILAAGLITFGRLDMVEFVITALPTRKIVLDHGAGWCSLLPYRIVAELFPLPEELRDYGRWIKETPQAEALVAWFRTNLDRLQWDGMNERFLIRQLNQE